MLKQLGLQESEINYDEDDFTIIIEWLKNTNKHFGRSAFLALKQIFLNNQVSCDMEDLAVKTILLDIFTGIITSLIEGEVEISMFALSTYAANRGITLYNTQLDTSSLGSLRHMLENGQNVIIRVEGNHFIVVTEIDEDGTISYIETSKGLSGEIMHMGQEKLLSIWEGYAITQKAPVEEYGRQLTSHEAMQIRGSDPSIVFFIISLVSAIVSTVLSFIDNEICQMLSRIFAVVSLITGVLATVLNFDSIIRGFSGALADIGKNISNSYNNMANVFKEGINAFAVGVTSIMENIPTMLIGLPLNHSYNIALTTFGVDSNIAGITSAFLAGGFTTPSANFGSFQLVGGLRGLTVESVRYAGKELKMDPIITDLIGISAATIVSAGLGGVLIPDPEDPELFKTIYGLEAISHSLEETILPTVAGELSYYGIQKLGENIGLDPRISYLAGIAIRSSLRAGFSDGQDPGAILQGALTGAMQGVTSLGINYAVEEMGINPLVANLGISAISSILDGVFTPTYQGDTRNIMEKVIDSYGNNLLTMLGHNPMPDKMNPIYWPPNADGSALIFNETKYTTALNSYYQNKPWMEASYAGQITEFTDIARNQGIETALNTYATSLFNSVAVNKITTLANVAVTNIGTYFKTVIDDFKTDPANTQNVTEALDADGNKVITIGLKDEETGKIELTGRFREIFDETYEKYFYTFNGYELGGQFNAFGDWAVDASGNGGMINGEYFEWWNGMEFYNEIVQNEKGLSVPRKVTIADLETGTYTEIDLADPTETEMFSDTSFEEMLEDYTRGTINTTEFDLFYENQIYKINFGDIDPDGLYKQPEITYYLFDSKPLMTIEKTDIEYYKSDGTFEVIDNGAEIVKMLNDDGTLRSIKVNLNEVFEEPIQKVLTKNMFGEIETYDFTEEGVAVKFVNGKLYVISKERFGEFTLDVPSNMTMFDHKAEVEEYRDKMLEQWSSDQDFSDTKTVIYDDFRDYMNYRGVLPEDMAIYQELFHPGELGVKVVDDITTKSECSYGIKYGNTENSQHILTSHFKDENYTYLDLNERVAVENDNNFTVAEIAGTLYDVTIDGREAGPEVSGRECRSEFWVGEGLEAKKASLTVMLYTVVDQDDPENVEISLVTRLEFDDGSMYMQNVTTDSYSKDAVKDTERKRNFDKLNIYLKDGMGLPNIDFEIPLDYANNTISTDNEVLNMQAKNELNKMIKEGLWK
jgi:hypothetical protein